MPDKVSLARVQELAATERVQAALLNEWTGSHAYLSDIATALEALVRLVGAGKALLAEQARPVVDEQSERVENALVAALAAFIDDRAQAQEG